MPRQTFWVVIFLLLGVTAFLLALSHPYNLETPQTTAVDAAEESGLDSFDRIYNAYCQTRSKEDVREMLSVARELAVEYRQQRDLEVEKRLEQILVEFPDPAYLEQNYSREDVDNFTFIGMAYFERSQARLVEGGTKQTVMPC